MDDKLKQKFLGSTLRSWKYCEGKTRKSKHTRNSGDNTSIKKKQISIQQIKGKKAIAREPDLEKNRFWNGTSAINWNKNS